VLDFLALAGQNWQYDRVRGPCSPREGHRLSRAAGFNHHLIKPVQIDDLVSLFREEDAGWFPAHRA
jgi:hypothetical protein